MRYITWIVFTTLILGNCQSQDLLPFRVDTLWGFRNKQGAVKIEPQFQYANNFRYGVAIVLRNERVGAIDSNGKLIIPFRYEYLRPLDSTEFLFGYRTKYVGEHIVGVMSRDEKVKIPAEYSYISKYKQTYRVIKEKDSIWDKTAIGDLRSRRIFAGLLDSNGKVLLPCKYNSVQWINDSLFSVDSSFAQAGRNTMETRLALFTNRGEQLTGFQYKVFGKFIDGIAKARIGDKFGFIYPSGKVAIPIQFDYCEEFNNGYALMQQKERWGAINKKGEIVVEPKFSYEEVKIMLKEK